MFIRTKTGVEVSSITGTHPIVMFTPEVLYAQKVIVDHCKIEVGWVGLVTKKSPRLYCVDEIFVPTQTATGVECDILKDGYGDIELALNNRGTPDRIFDLKYWGHSHVDMEVFASAEDKKTALQKAIQSDYFIRGICNKKGGMHLSFFDGNAGIAYENIDWLIDDNVDKDAVRKRYQEEVEKNVNVRKPAINIKPIPTMEEIGLILDPLDRFVDAEDKLPKVKSGVVRRSLIERAKYAFS
jgi:hypothetical protein